MFSYSPDEEMYNRGTPQPMKHQRFRDSDFNKKPKFKDDKRKRREAFERKRGSDN